MKVLLLISKLRTDPIERAPPIFFPELFLKLEFSIKYEFTFHNPKTPEFSEIQCYTVEFMKALYPTSLNMIG